jgi:TatD DNase family protein
MGPVLDPGTRVEPLPVDVVDSHCHLDLMRVPVAETLAAARAVGVRRVVTVGYDLESSRWCARTAAEHDAVSAAVAVHPNSAHTADEAAYDEIARLAALPQVRAVGETGLDHYRSGAERWPGQEEAFRRHIALAKQAGKALVVHDRDAHDDVLRVLAEEGAPDPTVFHCFSGDAAMATVCADRGYVLSFAGNVTFKNADGLRAAAAVVPLDLLLVETDAPFLTPVPHRGRPNAPALVALTVRAVAAVQRREVAEVAAAVAATAERVFGPSPPGPSSTASPSDAPKLE